MKKYPRITNIIRGALNRDSLSARDLAKLTGIPYQTLMIQRFNDPGSWRFHEWGAVLRHVDFLPEELKEIEKEIKK